MPTEPIGRRALRAISSSLLHLNHDAIGEHLLFNQLYNVSSEIYTNAFDTNSLSSRVDPARGLSSQACIQDASSVIVAGCATASTKENNQKMTSRVLETRKNNGWFYALDAIVVS